jgi:hypothetical protein
MKCKTGNWNKSHKGQCSLIATRTSTKAMCRHTKGQRQQRLKNLQCKSNKIQRLKIRNSKSSPYPRYQMCPKAQLTASQNLSWMTQMHKNSFKMNPLAFKSTPNHLRSSMKSILTRVRTFQQVSDITTRRTPKVMLKSTLIEKGIDLTISLCSNKSNSTKHTHKISPTTNSSDGSLMSHAKSFSIQIRSTKNQSHPKTSKPFTSISPN